MTTTKVTRVEDKNGDMYYIPVTKVDAFLERADNDLSFNVYKEGRLNLYVQDVDGTNIPRRDLTSEETTRDITLERIAEYHYEAGEDLLDQANWGYNSVLSSIYFGWLLGKYPEYAEPLTVFWNSQRSTDIHMWQEAYTDILFDVYKDVKEQWEGEAAHTLFYKDFCEFTNTKKGFKEQVNEYLIRHADYYLS